VLTDFTFQSPTTLGDCLDLMAAQAPDVAPIAGGTNLVVDLRSGRAKPKCVVDLCRLASLSYVRQENGRIAIGGRTSVTELLQSPLLHRSGGAIVASAGQFASPLIRNRATIAGNIADASPAADLAPPLLALGAEAILTSKSGTRCVPLEQFFLGPRQTVRRPDELLTAIRYPRPGASAVDTFVKLGLRREDAIAVVSVATYVERQGELCSVARIALGAVAPSPIRARQAEDVLVGATLREDTIRHAAHIAANVDAQPISDVRGSAEYRRWMVEVLVRRALLKGVA
jgi:CO/xanthine dehydrogenase FAD-binding subunit